MKKFLNFILLTGCIMISNMTIGQSGTPKKHNHPSGKMNAVSVGADLPLGNFSSTHSIGVGTCFSWSDHRFGGMDVKPVKSFGFTANAGVAYYFGEKETVSGYTYDYHRYIFIHAYAGAIYNPWRKGNIILTAGPASGGYNGYTRFNIGSCLEGSYYIKEKIAISPGIMMMKESGADPLWSASLKATITF
ncbi:MAG TPA: hypothetical protein VIV35_03280 [Chitinophagaceae bacterium]